jgi:exodeoxyribonuclease V alpha subunit
LRSLTLCDLRQSCAVPQQSGKALKRAYGRDAVTIHRLLEVSFEGEGSRFSFVHDEDEPIDADVVILDETSMVDVDLMNSLVRAIRPGARLIMVGDPDQLPSVGREMC